MVTLAAYLKAIPRLKLNVTKRGDWWLIHKQRPDGTWAIVRRCKGSRVKAENTVQKYLEKNSSALGDTTWPE